MAGIDLSWVNLPLKRETHDGYVTIIDGKGEDIAYIPFKEKRHTKGYEQAENYAKFCIERTYEYLKANVEESKGDRGNLE